MSSRVVETEVVEEKTVIIVESADPEVIYVPSYNPTYVYPPPVYPYPPVYYPPYYAGGAFVVVQRRGRVGRRDLGRFVLRTAAGVVTTSTSTSTTTSTGTPISTEATAAAAAGSTTRSIAGARPMPTGQRPTSSAARRAAIR